MSTTVFYLWIVFVLPGESNVHRILMDVASCDLAPKAVELWNQQGRKVVSAVCMRDVQIVGEVVAVEGV